MERRATVEPEATEVLQSVVEAIMQRGESEPLELGTHSQLSADVTALVAAYGDAAVRQLAWRCLGSTVDQFIVREVLHTLGAMKDPESHNYRRWLLQEALFHGASAVVRFAAATGLADLADPVGWEAIRRAVESEPGRDARNRMSTLLEDLQ